MRSGALHRLRGLCAVLVAACVAACGEASHHGPATSDAAAGGAGPDSAAGGVQGTAGVQGAGGVQGTAGVQGTGGLAGGGPSPTGGTSGAGGAAGAVALSFAADIWPVFDQTRQPVFVYRGMGSYAGCTAATPCHSGNTVGARLNMSDASRAYAGLVNVASVSSLCAGTIRVVPGDPDSSCLVLFYEGRLRDDLQWVGDAEIDLVRRWIAQGARP
jgi:hypothetical protein